MLQAQPRASCPCCADGADDRRGTLRGQWDTLREALTRPVAAPTVPATMRNIDLERFLLSVALPPVRLGLYVKQLTARRADPAARTVATNELRRAARIRVRLARQGWWN